MPSRALTDCEPCTQGSRVTAEVTSEVDLDHVEPLVSNSVL